MSRIQVRAIVRIIASDNDSQARKYIDQTGTLIADDNSSVPYEVQFADGERYWFNKSDIKDTGEIDNKAEVKYTVGAAALIVATDGDDNSQSYAGSWGTIEQVDNDSTPYKVEFVQPDGETVSTWFKRGSVRCIAGQRVYVTGGKNIIHALLEDFIAMGGELLDRGSGIAEGTALHFDFDVPRKQKPTVRLVHQFKDADNAFEAISAYQEVLDAITFNKPTIADFKVNNYEVKLEEGEVKIGCKTISVEVLADFAALNAKLPDNAKITQVRLDGHNVSATDLDKLLKFAKDNE